MEYHEFKASTITCKECGWSGPGRFMQVGEVHERGMMSEYHCPRCEEYWGAIAWPEIGGQPANDALPVVSYPRVAVLRYRITHGPGHEYANDAAFDGELHGFSVSLRGRDATFTPLKHFADEASARAALEPQVRAWELDAVMNQGLGAFALKFVTAHVHQQPPGEGISNISGLAEFAFATDAISVYVTHHRHPPPPEAFVVDERVEVLADLYLFAREVPRVLLHAAYSMTTFVQEAYGSFEVAARSFAISQNVFEAIARLANTRGVGVEARKFNIDVKRSPLTELERAWLLEIMLQVARRAGAEAAGRPVGKAITLETNPVPMSAPAA